MPVLNEFYDDISSIYIDLQNSGSSISLDEAAEITVMLLKCIHKKKHIQELIFKPYIKQVIALLDKENYGFHYNNFIVIV